MKPDTLTTNRKALTINLDSAKYGTFAEIGAGQEVARHFFQAGGTAGTVAKSMSAYDMKFSDDIYGKSQRYVSKERLLQILDHEFSLLEQRLSESRGSWSTFFAFGNTVAARSHKGGDECHGWMGIRFQMQPRTPPSDVLIHVRMLDEFNVQQQDALGIFGVNVIYGAFFYRDDPFRLIESLADNIGKSRVEVDMINFNGPGFEKGDNRILSLRLVESGFTKAVMFGPDCRVLQPSEELYKKAILVERGSFHPFTNVNLDMLHCAGAQFMQEEELKGGDIVTLMEMTMRHLRSDKGADKGIEISDFLARVDTITALGYTVLVSNYVEYYKLSAYFRRYTHEMVGIVLGINSLVKIFDESYYEKLDGGILESFGRLFKEKVKLYIYPMQAKGYQKYLSLDQTRMPFQIPDTQLASEVFITAENLKVSSHLRHLYNYLIENHFIEPVVGPNREYMNIFSREVLDKIKAGDADWEKMVPDKVAALIKKRHLWGYQSSQKDKTPTAASHSSLPYLSDK